jgi:hypothetical protein
MHDSGSGLSQLVTDTQSTDYYLLPESVPFASVAVVNVTYESSCCFRSANITVYDVAGNKATCYLRQTSGSYQINGSFNFSFALIMTIVTIAMK